MSYVSQNQMSVVSIGDSEEGTRRLLRLLLHIALSGKGRNFQKCSESKTFNTMFTLKKVHDTRRMGWNVNGKLKTENCDLRFGIDWHSLVARFG